jgi:Uma2 family endonuclease
MANMAHTVSTECDTAFRVSLDVHSIHLTDEQFDLLCRDNNELRLEFSAKGELIIMSMTYTETGRKKARILHRLADWAETDGTGRCYSSSAGFTLPNGSKRAVDASWISHKRWNSLKPEHREKMARICPDFVIEMRSETNPLPELKKKMAEYIQNGARLGWLFDPIDKRVYIYRPGRRVECLESPNELSGEDVLPGFQFNFQEIVSERS